MIILKYNRSDLGDMLSESALEIARHTNGFDQDGANNVLSPMAVLSDRLTREDFADLSGPAKDALRVMGHIANDLVELDERNFWTFRDDSEEELEYRKTFELPIHALQRRIYTRDYNESNKEDMNKLRFAARAAGEVFSIVWNEAKIKESIIEDEQYYLNYALQAARHALNLRRDKLDEIEA